MRLLVSALEPSSNIHLSYLLKHLKGVKLSGIFDRTMSNDQPLFDVTSEAVMGFFDIARKIPKFLHMQKVMIDSAKDADKVLLIDGSGFNLPLAQKIKQQYPQKEILYYILPQVWATRPKRAYKLESSCDRLLGILPFEKEYYPTRKAEYVGHPLLDQITVTRKPVEKTIAFLPGSRPSEIKRLLPVFNAVREKLGDSIRPLLVIPPHFDRQAIGKIYRENRRYEIIRNTHEALAMSEFAFICSGTATLESALIGTPFVLTYIAKPIDYMIAKKFLGLKRVGLANILLEHQGSEPLHEELLQDRVTVQKLLNAYHNTRRDAFAKKSALLRNYLRHGSAETTAKIILGA